MKESPCKKCKHINGRCKSSSAWCGLWGDWFATEWREMRHDFTGAEVLPLGRKKYDFKSIVKEAGHGKKET